jgi:hypothetical protein
VLPRRITASGSKRKISHCLVLFIFHDRRCKRGNSNLLKKKELSIPRCEPSFCLHSELTYIVVLELSCANFYRFTWQIAQDNSETTTCLVYEYNLTIFLQFLKMMLNSFFHTILHFCIAYTSYLKNEYGVISFWTRTYNIYAVLRRQSSTCITLKHQ